MVDFKPIIIILLLILVIMFFINPTGTKDKVQSTIETGGKFVSDKTGINIPLPKSTEPAKSTNSTITIANWNLQIFGITKSSDANLMNKYADKINEYDIVFVQEIRDSSDTAFKSLCSLLPDYNCVESSRAGRSTSKEQYGLIYKKGLQLESTKDFSPDQQDRWERPPFEAIIDVGSYNLTLYNIHTKPEDVPNEMTNLASVVSDNGYVIILGDLNADGAYYNNIVETQFDNWDWVIADGQDTTVGTTAYTYDRIIADNLTRSKIVDYGIDSSITEDMSDHYIVWVKLKQ